ncbi:hypothetical protein AB834_03875 [PVC group bacterium (ex Bugula neritina AB1)]|nr:hypothetical protein AB834_03875 [PVC group bacterium (ex Bugula neritina AB1)]
MERNAEYLSAKALVQKLVNHGYISYFAGGCVRDHLLGLPTQDIDIATNASPSTIKSLFKKTILVGEQFGVVIVQQDSFHFEVTTFRQDLDYKDGRHPEKVVFLTDKEDASRRDFTINGLFYNPLTEEIIDHVGGRKDLELKIIRTIGSPEKRFQEDKLRMMRAVRFAARFDFPIDPQTHRAIQNKAKDIHQVSKERIRDELCKMFTGNNRGTALQLLNETGLLNEILPETLTASPLFSTNVPKNENSSVLFVTRKLLDQLPDKPSNALAIASILHTIPPPKVDHLCKKWLLPKKETRLISHYVSTQMCFTDAMLWRQGPLKKKLQSPSILEELIYFKALCQTYNLRKELENHTFCLTKLDLYSHEELHPSLFVTGKQLVAWGYEQSPLFSTIIKKLEILQLENHITTLQEAKNYVEKHFPNH